MIPLSLWSQSNSASIGPCGCRYSAGGSHKGGYGLRASAAPGGRKASVGPDTQLGGCVIQP